MKGFCFVCAADVSPQHFGRARACHIETTSLSHCEQICFASVSTSKSHLCLNGGFVTVMLRAFINNSVFLIDISGTLTFCTVAHNMLELFCSSSYRVKSWRPDSLFLDGALRA